MQNKPFLLSVIAFLALLRFLVVPIFEWQDETLAKTQQLQKKIDKSLVYINNATKLEAYNVDLSNALAVRNQAREVYSDVGRYQLAKQRQLESLFQQYDIRIKTSNWLEPIKTAQSVTLQYSFQFSGKLKNLIPLHLALSKLGRDILVTRISMNVSGQRGTSLGLLNGSGTIQFTPLEEADAVN